MSAKREPLPSGPDPGNQNVQLAELSLRLQEEIGKRERAENISRTIFEIAANINQVANLDALYRSIHQSLANIIDVTNFFIALYDKDKDTLSFPYFVDEMDSFEDYGEYNIKHVSQSNLASAEVIRTGRPFLIQKKEMIKYLQKRNSHLPGTPVGTPAEVWLGVPLKIKDEIMGVICTQSYRDPLHYTEKDIDILVSVSDQVAIAIDRKRADTEVQSRAIQANLLYEVGQRVGSKIKMDELLVAVVSNIQRVFSYSCVGIGLIDEQRQSIVFRAVAGRYTDIFAKGEVQAIEKGITGLAVRSGQTQLCGDVTKSPHYIRMADEATRSELSVPLKLRAKVIGILDLQSDDLDAFDETDVSVLETLATQIVSAIANARLFEDANKRAERLTILNRIGNIAVTADSLDQLIEAIYLEINVIFKPDAFFVAFLNDKADELEFRFVIEDGARQPIAKATSKNGLSSKVISDKKPLIILNLEKESCDLPMPVWFGKVRSVLTWIGVPLIFEEKVVGLVNIQSYTAYAWNEEDIQLFFTMTDQIAIAIDRKKNEEEARKRAERLSVLNRIGNIASTAKNLNKLMGSIYEEIDLIFKPDSFFIAFLDQATKELEFRFLIIDGKQEPITKNPLGDGLSYKIITGKQAIIINNYDQESVHLPTQYLFSNKKVAQSWIGVPLFFEDRIIGIVSLQSYKPNTWNQEDLQLFFTMVDQISAVIAKARLYESVQQELNERKKAEEAKKDLEIRLRQAQKMEAIGTLAGGIAHDFNNVLYPIIGYAEMTMDIVPKEGEVRKNLNEILVAAERARNLVKQILTFSRQQEIKPRPLQIQPLLKEALELIRSTIPSSISMIQNIDEHCGPILADPSQIHQIIMNLCTNAYHAMRQQGGVLEISLAEVQLDPVKNEKAFQCAPGLYLCLIVRDTGDGVDSKIIDRIFDPYFTTKPPGEGTGMGLAMVYGIVKCYGGEITVESQTGQGTRFKIYLPRLLEKMIEAVRLEKKTGLGQGERVLFIDDEDQVIRMVKQMLERLGYQAIVKKDSAEALEEFRRHPDDYDLVITDQTMPNITGLELSKKLLKIRADIPIILCTGFSEIINEEQAQAAGIRKFIMKPIAKKVLAQIIRETLDESCSNANIHKQRDHSKMEIVKK